MSSVFNSNSPASVAAALAQTRSRIAAAAVRYGREPKSVTLLAVSKQQPVESIRVLASAGQREFGESYLQEALPKMGMLKDLELTWHYIGQIQSNKTRPIAEHFAWAHAVDRLKIAERLNDQRPNTLPPLNICIQVKLAEESGKGGVHPDELPEITPRISALPHLRLRGLMCIPPPHETFDKQIPAFQQLATLFADLKRSFPW